MRCCLNKRVAMDANYVMWSALGASHAVTCSQRGNADQIPVDSSVSFSYFQMRNTRIDSWTNGTYALYLDFAIEWRKTPIGYTTTLRLHGVGAFSFLFMSSWSIRRPCNGPVLVEYLMHRNGEKALDWKATALTEERLSWILNGGGWIENNTLRWWKNGQMAHFWRNRIIWPNNIIMGLQNAISLKAKQVLHETPSSNRIPSPKTIYSKLVEIS